MDSDELEEPTSGSSAAFQRAADYLASSLAAGSSAFDGVKLQAYGLYKLCTAGPCTGGRPGFWDVQGRTKWDAWSKAGALPREEAMQRYVELVASIEPGWAGGGGVEHQPEQQQQEQRKGRKGALGGPVFSTMAACVGEEEDAGGPRQGGGQQQAGAASEGGTTLHALVGGSDLQGLQELLASGAEVDEQDDQGCTPLHFAADRGAEQAAQMLLAAGAQVNAQDDDGQTPLHYAALCGHEHIAHLLIEAGAESGITDASGQTARETGPAGWSWPH